MTPEEYYRDVSKRLHQARLDLLKAYDEYRTEDASNLVRLIQTLVPEEIDAYNAYMKS